MTKKTKTWAVLLTIFSILLNVGPLAVYTIIALTQGTLTHQKIAVCLTVFCVLILTAVAVLNKVAMKSRIWILLCGLYVALEYILTPLIIIAVCQVLDELVISPLAKHYRNRYRINKEIDLRS